MLKDEFHRLMALFRDGSEGKVNLHQLFTESLAFFQHLKEEFEHASPEEKQELMKMMMSMNKEIMEESKRIMKTAGMSEDQLLAYAENPSNFTPEQWKAFQESKSQIHKAGTDLFQEIQKIIPSPELKTHSVQPVEKKNKLPPGHKKSHRSDWQRS